MYLSYSMIFSFSFSNEMILYDKDSADAFVAAWIYRERGFRTKPVSRLGIKNTETGEKITENIAQKAYIEWNYRFKYNHKWLVQIANMKEFNKKILSYDIGSLMHLRFTEFMTNPYKKRHDCLVMFIFIETLILLLHIIQTHTTNLHPCI